MSHSHEDQLFVGIRVVAQRGDFRTILNPSEEDFRGIGGRVWTTKNRVVGVEGSGGGFSIYRTELVEDHYRRHSRMPAVNACQIGQLESVIDARVQRSEACTFDVLHR